MGGYLSRIGDLVDIFDSVYRNFSNRQRVNSLKRLAELLQVGTLRGVADDFFISDHAFLTQDFILSEQYIGGKLSCVTAFINRAIYLRQA